MPKIPNLFGTVSTSSLLGSLTTTSSAREVDLRAELDELFFGHVSGVRHGHLVVLRNMRRENGGHPVKCTCLDPFTREADPDCSFCLGERYLWDEGWAWTHSSYLGSDGGLASRITYMPSGAMRVDSKVFYFRYDTNIRYSDKIIEMVLDTDGNVVVPYIRETIYRPGTIQRFRSDNGRLEYIAVHCREEDAIRLDTPENA